MKAGKWVLFGTLTLTLLCFSCASSDKKEKEEKFNEESVTVIDLPLPKEEVKSYFYTVDPKILSLVENGSPDSIQQAVSLLYKKSASGFADNEKILLSVCKDVCSIVWPSKSVNWESPEILFENPYTATIKSAKSGIYETSTNKKDFLTLVLPSLVLFKDNIQTENLESAEKDLNSALQLKADSVLANYLYAILKSKEGKSDEATIFLAKALKNAPNTFELQVEQAELNYILKNYDKALQTGQALLAKDTQNLDLLDLCTRASYALKDYETAENYVLRLLQLEPENTAYILKRADLLIKKEEYIKASSLLDVAGRTDTSSRDYLLLRAKLQREWNKNNSLASETIAKALALYPTDSEILLTAAKISSDSGALIGGKAALELLQTLLESDKDNKEALSLCIIELAKEGSFEEAYKISTDLVKKEGNKKEDLLSHIDICISMNYMKEAWELTSALYKESPDDLDILQQYIKVLVASGRREEALKLIASLQGTSDGKLRSFLYYQKSLLDTSEDDILADLRTSLTSNPRNKDSLYRLYRIYYNKKDYRRARYYLKQVVALNPRDTGVLAKNAELDALLKQ